MKMTSLKTEDDIAMKSDKLYEENDDFSMNDEQNSKKKY
jgi:hypothetical protein